MSYVLAAPQILSAAASDLSGIGSSLTSAHAAAAAPTTAVIAAAGDEVSAAVASLFSEHGQAFQALGAQVSAFHGEFVQALSSGGLTYAATEAANAMPLGAAGSPAQTLEQDILGVVNAPSLALTGRALIGNGADGTAASPNGGSGGWLYGNGGNGFSQSGSPGVAGGADHRGDSRRR